jgi:hypothetical protein
LSGYAEFPYGSCWRRARNSTDPADASLGLVAWDLCVEEHEVAETWERAIADGLLKPSGHDDTPGGQLGRNANVGGREWERRAAARWSAPASC